MFLFGGFSVLKSLLLQKLSDEELAVQVKDLQKKFHGFLSEEGAVNLIASRYGLSAKAKPVELTKIRDFRVGGTVSFNCVLLSALAPRRFEVNGRKGFVANATVADETGQATLVFWNKDAFTSLNFERNSFLLVKNAFVKQEGEAHSRLVTEVLAGGEDDAFPKSGVRGLKVNDCIGLVNFDVYGRVLEKSSVREFTAKGKPGLLVKALLADESGQRGAVFWNSNAEQFNRLSVGDVVKIEGAYEKDGEIHAGKDARVLKSGKAMESTDLLYAKMFPERTIAQAKEGEQCIVTADVVKALSLNVFYRCACGRKPASRQCECGKTAEELLVLNAEVSDGFSSTRCAFFNDNARLLLGIKELSIPYNTVFSLKRDYLANNKVKFIAMPKFSSFSKKLEFTAKHVLSIKTPYEMPS